ncbi:MAG: PKD domain-containing protein, partial [Solirubrobacteraceae bacterium]
KNCSDVTQYSQGPCLVDSDIQKEVERVAGATPTGLHDIYLVLTPPGVGGCFGGSTEECAYKQYCAYHGDFGGDGKTLGEQTLYADLPYLGEVIGCDSGVHPNEQVSLKEEKEGVDVGADAVIDTASHELNETITDPIGSQCDEESGKIIGCEANAWTDAIGQEIGDKCLPPESTIDGIYGGALGELLPGRPASAYNQLINGEHYWTQRVWSNEAGVFEGGCVQRLIEAKILVSINAAATVPVTFDGSASGAPGDPSVYWVWDFGGEQVGTSSPRITHTYPKSGEYLVTLTAYDAYGNAQATVGVLTVAPAPPSPPGPVNPTSTVPVKEVKEVKVPLAVAHYSSAQIAALLGLPASGARVRVGSSITLGHASCPPACAITLNLYTKVTSGKHRHRQVLIGKFAHGMLTTTQQAILLKLNATARKLLQTHHRLAVTLKLSVVGQEGASWSISRSLILTT